MALEQVLELRLAAQPDRLVVAPDEVAAIEFGAAVDEGRHAGADQVAAEIVVIEHRPLQEAVLAGPVECGLRHDRGRRLQIDGTQHHRREQRHDGEAERGGRGAGRTRELLDASKQACAGCLRVAGQHRELPRQQRRESERRQGRQQLGIAGMAQIEMQKADHDQQAQQRQLEATRQREVERDQQHDLLRRLLLEVGRLPFGDRIQHVAQAEDAAGDQDRFRTVGRDAGDQQRRHAELQPGEEQALAFTAVARADQRLEREGAGQHQAEREAAMHVGPEQHGEQQQGFGTAALLDGAHQTRDPDQHEREGEHVRTRQDMRRHHHRGTDGEHQCRQRPEVAQQQAEEQREARRDGSGAERNHAHPAHPVIGEREQQLRQPFLGDPRLAEKGEGERIDVGHRAMRQHPVADRDVPVAVGIGQQRHAVGVDQTDEQQHAQDQWQRKRQGRTGRAEIRGNRKAGSDGHERLRNY